MVVDLLWNKPVRLAVKLPEAPETLGLDNPYPALAHFWVSGDREWCWTIPSSEMMPDLTIAVDIAVKFNHASSG